MFEAPNAQNIYKSILSTYPARPNTLTAWDAVPTIGMVYALVFGNDQRRRPLFLRNYTLQLLPPIRRPTRSMTRP